MPRKAPSRGVSLDRFVVSWTKAKSVAQVAKWTGMKPQAASIKASLLRKKGVALKKFETAATAGPVAPKVWTVAALNDLIKEANGAPKPGRKKLGRPKGSKNKPKEEDGAILSATGTTETASASIPQEDREPEISEEPESEDGEDEVLAGGPPDELADDEPEGLAATDELDDKFPRL